MLNNSIEHLLPIYIDEDLAQIQSPFYLRRLDYFGKRFYYTVDEFLNVNFYLSTTTFIKSVLPENKFLTDWRINVAVEKGSKDLADAYVGETALYGTIMHVLIGEIVKAKKFNWSQLEPIIYRYTENVSPYMLRAWIRDLQKDLLAFCQWVSEYNVNVLAVEFPIVNDDEGNPIATCIDLVVEMDKTVTGFFGEVYKSGDKKGMPKESKQVDRIKAIIDFKSGRKGFYDSHELQLELSKKMWNDYFRGTPYEVDHIYNWSPKDWSGESPTYNLKDQSDSVFKGNTDLFFKLGNVFSVFNFSRFNIDANIEFELGCNADFIKKSIHESIKEYESVRRDNQE
jgi:hypothetical protein